MQFQLTMVQPDGVVPDRSFLDVVMARLDEVRAEIVAAGQWVGSAGLAPAEASTVIRRIDGERLVSDGPYVESTEHVGGFYLIDVPDLDGAIRWADRIIQVTTLPMEVRPVAFSTFTPAAAG